MRRRDLLAAVGTAGALSVAGCVGYETTDAGVDGPDDGDADQPDDERSDAADGQGDGDGERLGGSAPVETVAIGDREGVPFPDNNRPHGVRVANDAAGARELRVVVARDGDQVLDRVFDVPGGDTVALTLNQPAGHEVAVGAGGRLLDTVTVPRSRFDCNGSTTEVTVDGDGEVTSTTISTLVACPGPEVTDTRFEQGEGTCGAGGRAAVTTAGERVRVSGTVRTPVPCYDLALSDVELVEADEFGGRSGTLVVTVSTAGRQDGACVECVGGVSYEATVDLDRSFPETVRVVHAGLGGERTVTETTLG